MPHIIIEYAQELASDAQVAEMLAAVHQAVATTTLFVTDNIKTRAWPVACYQVGTANTPFIHGQCRIHAGRSAEQKRRLSEAVLAALCAQGWPAGVITVEVVEMDRASYAKWS